MIKFKFLVLMKKTPYYIYCMTLEDAETTVSHYPKEDIIGVAEASDGSIEVKEIKSVMTLEGREQLMIPILNDEGKLPDEDEVMEATFKEVMNEPPQK